MCPVNSAPDSRSQKAREESDRQSHSVHVSPPVETRRKRAQQGRAPPPGGLRLGGENGAPGTRSTRAASGPLRFKSRGAWEGRGQSHVWGDVAKTPFPYFPAWPDAWARCRAPRKPRSSSGAPRKTHQHAQFRDSASQIEVPRSAKLQTDREVARPESERHVSMGGSEWTGSLALVWDGVRPRTWGGKREPSLGGPAPHKTAAHDFHGPPTNHEHAVQGWKQ